MIKLLEIDLSIYSKGARSDAKRITEMEQDMETLREVVDENIDEKEKILLQEQIIKDLKATNKNYFTEVQKKMDTISELI